MAIQYETPLDRTFHALGDGTRRQMLAILAAEGPRSAGDLAERFDSAQPTLSRHLKVLETAGLVRREIDGRTHNFSLETERMLEAQEWISRHRKMWDAMLDNLEVYLAENAPEQDAP